MPTLQEFNKNADEPYFFENDEQPYFVSAEALASALSAITNESNAHGIKEVSQIKTLIVMENLKRGFALGNVTVDDYRIQLKSIMHVFFQENGFDVFHETVELQQFYQLVNEFYFRKEGFTNVAENF